MKSEHMLERIGHDTLVIVPGDREDVILALTDGPSHGTGARRNGRGGAFSRRAGRTPCASLGAWTAGAALGLVLTGGYRPRPAVLAAIRGADLFATLVREDTYAVASEVHDLLVKTHSSDTREDRARSRISCGSTSRSIRS